MSEDQRRWNRTQGRYGAGNQNGSDRKKGNFESFGHNEDEHNASKEHFVRKNKKQSSQRKRQSDAEAYTKKTSSPRQSYGSNVAQPNIKVEYQETSEGAVYSGLEDKPHIVEIRNEGWTTISETEHGESRLYYAPDFMNSREADHYFDILDRKVNWYDKKVVIQGVEHRQPRLVAWYGPLPYTYSGVTLEAEEFPATILKIKKSVEEVLKMTNVDVDLNSVLLNLYRDEKDSVAWHSDDETSMGIHPTIASVSLGEIRRFEMRKKPLGMRSDAPPELVVRLQHGSLVVMDGVMQTDWQHRVPKEYHSKRPRINLTFRTVFKIENVPRTPTFSDLAECMKPAFPKKTSKPFQFEGEAFPALGEPDGHKVQSKSQPQRTNPKTGDESNSSTEGIAKEIKFHNDGMTETEPNNPEYSSPLNYPSDEMQDDETWKSSNESQISDTHTEHLVVNADISMDTDPIGIWEGIDVAKVVEFVPSNPQGFEGKSRHRNSPENKNRSGNYRKSSEHGHQYERSGSSNLRTPKKSHQNNPPKCKPNDEEEIARLNEIYDYIGKNRDMCIKPHRWDEVTLLMTIVEHSENLPIHVVSKLADRLEFLKQEAEESYNRPHHQNYRYPNRGNFKRNDRGNRGYKKHNY